MITHFSAVLPLTGNR